MSDHDGHTYSLPADSHPHPAPSAAEMPKPGRFTDDHGDDIDVMHSYYADDGSPALIITERPGKGGPQASIRLTPKLAEWLIDSLAASPPAELSPVGLSEALAVAREGLNRVEAYYVCSEVADDGDNTTCRGYTDDPAEWCGWCAALDAIERVDALLASPAGPQREGLAEENERLRGGLRQAEAAVRSALTTMRRWGDYYESTIRFELPSTRRGLADAAIEARAALAPPAAAPPEDEAG